MPKIIDFDRYENIDEFVSAYPNAVIVATDRAFVMMNRFFGTDYADRRIVVAYISLLLNMVLSSLILCYLCDCYDF
ncbi:MAG: hypothetical protein ACI4SX_00405 [Candidatus Fimenecus sp.]